MVDYPTLTGRVCELASGTVVAPGDIAQLLARDDTLIQRVVFDGPNRVRDISTARTFRGTLRHVLDAVHRRCDHPTCHVPAHRCQGDHIIPWSHGGATTQTNGRLACGPHNRWWYTHQRHRPAGDSRPDPPSGHMVGHGSRACLPRAVTPDLLVCDGRDRVTIRLDRTRHAVRDR